MGKFLFILVLFSFSCLVVANDKIAKRNQCFYDVLLSFSEQLNDYQKSKLFTIVESLNDSAQGKIGSIMSIGKMKEFDKSVLVKAISNDIENIRPIHIDAPIEVRGYTELVDQNLTVGIKAIGVDDKFIFNTFLDIGKTFVKNVYGALDLPKIPLDVPAIANQIQKALPKLPRSVTDKLPETIQTWFFPKGEGYHMAQIVYGIFKGITKTIASNPQIKTIKINADLVMNKNLKKMFTEFGFVDAKTKLPLTAEEIQAEGKYLELIIQLP